MDNENLKAYIIEYLKPKVFKLLPLAQSDKEGYLRHKKFVLIQLDGAISYNKSITRLLVIRNNIKGLDSIDDFKTIRKVVLDSCQDLEVIVNEL